MFILIFLLIYMQFIHLFKKKTFSLCVKWLTKLTVCMDMEQLCLLFILYLLVYVCVCVSQMNFNFVL